MPGDKVPAAVHGSKISTRVRVAAMPGPLAVAGREAGAAVAGAAVVAAGTVAGAKVAGVALAVGPVPGGAVRAAPHPAVRSAAATAIMPAAASPGIAFLATIPPVCALCVPSPGIDAAVASPVGMMAESCRSTAT
jgi:hypothetical protein